jgi:hypothetical protein
MYPKHAFYQTELRPINEILTGKIFPVVAILKMEKHWNIFFKK